MFWVIIGVGFWGSFFFWRLLRKWLKKSYQVLLILFLLPVLLFFGARTFATGWDILGWWLIATGMLVSAIFITGYYFYEKIKRKNLT